MKLPDLKFKNKWDVKEFIAKRDRLILYHSQKFSHKFLGKFYNLSPSRIKAIVMEQRKLGGKP